MFIRPHVSREFKIHSLDLLRLDYESNPKDHKCPVRGHWCIQSNAQYQFHQINQITSWQR